MVWSDIGWLRWPVTTAVWGQLVLVWGQLVRVQLFCCVLSCSVVF